jgi:hypothetical protein
MPSGTNSVAKDEPRLSKLPADQFWRRYISALVAVTRDGAPPLHRSITCMPGFGLEVVIDDGTAPFRALVPGPTPSDKLETRDSVLDEREAFVELIDLCNTCFPEKMVTVYDRLACRIWEDITADKALEPGDLVFLDEWTKARAPCGYRLPADQAERLFGDSPVVSLDGQSPLISWEGVERLARGNIAYQGRREAAEAIFADMANDAVERYSGAVYVAFLQSLDEKKN